jgi:tRNA pseudouridine-54 N-methylase
MTHSLDPVVFWRLRAACGDTQRLQVLAQATMEALKTAQRKQDDLVLQLALEHGFDPKASFVLEDDTLTIVLPEGAALKMS